MLCKNWQFFKSVSRQHTQESRRRRRRRSIIKHLWMKQKKKQIESFFNRHIIIILIIKIRIQSHWLADWQQQQGKKSENELFITDLKSRKRLLLLLCDVRTYAHIRKLRNITN